MDLSKNYYQILGLSNKATIEEIKLSYRNLSKVYHPDISKEEDCINIFNNIVEAHKILNTNKSEYDLKSIFGKDWTEDLSMKEFEFSNGGKEYDNFKAVIDKTKGERIHIVYVLDSFKEELEYDRYILCNNCDGLGKDTSKLSDCLVCKGDKVNKNGDKCFMCNGEGKLTSLECEMCEGKGTYMDQQCRLCKGNGSISLSKCTTCDGDGRKLVKNKIHLLEEDINDENMIILKNYGNCSKTNIGIFGDLCIKIKKPN